MASFLDFLGGAAGAYGQIKTEDRKRKQLEEYNNRLRQQELEDYEKKIQIQNRARAGQAMGNPQITARGQAVGFVYGPDGVTPEFRQYGEVPGAREDYEAKQQYELQKHNLELQLLTGRISNQEYERRLKEASIADRQAGAALKRDRLENPDRHRSISTAPRTEAFVEDRAISKAAAEEGLVFDPSTQSMYSDDGEIKTPVDAARRQSIISRATMGKTRENPVDVATEEERDKLPPNTYFRFRGRLGITE